MRLCAACCRRRWRRSRLASTAGRSRTVLRLGRRARHPNLPPSRRLRVWRASISKRARDARSARRVRTPTFLADLTAKYVRGAGSRRTLGRSSARRALPGNTRRTIMRMTITHQTTSYAWSAQEDSTHRKRTKTSGAWIARRGGRLILTKEDARIAIRDDMQQRAGRLNVKSAPSASTSRTTDLCFVCHARTLVRPSLRALPRVTRARRPTTFRTHPTLILSSLAGVRLYV
mmetsp:Transcript_12297/g.33314  ORF Transcript_12297/g.33314 Transcript_12297/m.33314 type:complete len:231 (+) Transcript_12297:839-1531(+)